MMEDILQRIERANAEALRRILAGDPVVEDVRPALEVIPGMTADTILHAGPPVTWEHMSGPQRGGVIAALMFEKRADTPEKAIRLAASGAIQFSPCNEHKAVGAMGGITSPSTPVFIVKNPPFGNIAYCGWRDMGQVCGSYDEQTLRNLHWLREIGMPALSTTIRKLGGLELKPLWARALTMGDELHTRVTAGTAIFTRLIAPHLVRAVEDRSVVAEVFDYLADFDLAITPMTMAGCKAILDAAHGIEASTVVTCMARNGYEVGIRVSGLGDSWFVGPAQLVKGIYHPGFSDADACPDLGDSAIIETTGFGGFAIAAAPAHINVPDEQGSSNAAYTQQMYEITLAKNPSYPIPTLGFQGTATAIDIRKVVETGILPIVDTPAAHREPGSVKGLRGLILFGMARPPMECFVKALTAFGERYSIG